MGLAIAADVAQFLLGPLGWVFIDQAIDVAAMIGETLLLGFHPLLLPTFVVELIPVADMLPTWTGCVAVVLFLRSKGSDPPPAPAPGQSDALSKDAKVIDI